MRSLIGLLMFAAALAAQEPKTELLWPDGAPGAVGSEDRDKPSLTYCTASKPNGAAVLVCPGGGYGPWPWTTKGNK